jgi:geranylgeranyl transferase type-2 subunit beta
MEAVASEHLRLSGVYWGLTCCALLRAGAGALGDPAALADWVRACQAPQAPPEQAAAAASSSSASASGVRGRGFGPSPGHDAHLLYTLSAVQVLALLDQLHTLDADAVAAYVAGACGAARRTGAARRPHPQRVRPNNTRRASCRLCVCVCACLPAASRRPAAAGRLVRGRRRGRGGHALLVLRARHVRAAAPPGRAGRARRRRVCAPLRKLRRRLRRHARRRVARGTDLHRPRCARAQPHRERNRR